MGSRSVTLGAMLSEYDLDGSRKTDQMLMGLELAAVCEVAVIILESSAGWGLDLVETPE